MKNVLAMILAGGEGKRLYPLTAERSKPAVPFGGRYRIIDFVLSNFINSGITKIKVITQFKADSLLRHLSRGWQLSPLLGHYIDPAPAQMRTGPDWYRGTADAIYQNLDFIANENPDYVCIFGGDHIYKMDIGQMYDEHKKTGADLTVATIPFARERSREFGVVGVNNAGEITRFTEKPSEPDPMPGNPDMSLVSMGNYIFRREALVEMLQEDAPQETEHDFGKNIITSMIGRHKVHAYNFSRNEIPGATEAERGYWRDVGNLDQYWETSMDLVSVSPIFDLYNRQWPIHCYYPSAPPAKFVFANIGQRAGIATDSLIAEGCIVSGGAVHRSILSPFCRINSYSSITESILMEGVTVGRNARIQRAIIDKYVTIPEGATIGFDRDEDCQRFTVTDGGVVVIPKGAQIE